MSEWMQMSEWISASERKEFEAWKDRRRAELAAGVEGWAGEVLKFRLNTKDQDLKSSSQNLIDVLESFLLKLRGVDK